jgi:hypothetical protein
MAHFDPYWNKDNKRVSGMFQEVARRKEEEAAAAMRKPPPSTLLDGLHETNAGRRWRGGALQRLNATLNAQPRAVPPARPPAPTTDRRKSVGPVPTPGTNTLSRGYAPKAPGEQCTNEEIARKKEAALIRRLERERLEKEELQRKLDAALNQHQHQQQQQPIRGHANLTPNQPSAPQSAPKRTNPMVSLTAGKRPAMSSGRPVAQHPGDDKLWPDQLFEIDIVLGDDPAQAKEGDKLVVKAKSFPGYPAHAVLMDGSLRGRDMRKTLVEKGVVATWEVKPTAMYRPLVTRATREKLLRVDDRVSEKVTALRATADAAESRLKRSMDDVRTRRMEVPHDVRELVETARGTNTNPDPKPRKPGGRGGRGGRGRGRGKAGRRDETSEPAARPRFRSFAAADEEEKVGGLGESDLVAAIAFALRSTPGAKVNPATADAKALVRVLRHVQTQIGVPLGVSAKTDPRHLKLAPVVSRAVLKVGFDPTFGETKTPERRASGKESIANWFNEPAQPEPESAPVTAPESAPESSRDKVNDHDVIDLLSDDEAGASEEQPARHLPGSLVVVRGLISRPDLNGDVFEVRAWSTERSRYRLAQAGGGLTAREIYAKPENVSACSADDAGALNRGAAEEPVITIDDEEDEGPVCGQMSDDDLRELVIDQLRLATEEDRLERTTVRQIMDTLEKTYLVSLSGDRKSVVRECVDTYIAERTSKAREEEGRVAVERLRVEGLVDTIRRAATELIEAKKALRRIEEATKPRETRKRREPTAPTYDSADYVQFAPNGRTGAGMTWEGAGGMSFGPNVEDFY